MQGRFNIATTANQKMNFFLVLETSITFSNFIHNDTGVIHDKTEIAELERFKRQH